MGQFLSVAMNGIEVGKWSLLANGATEFQYIPEWLAFPRCRAISLSLPLSRKIYRGEVVYNFFDNLLPDSEQIRSRIQQRFQTQTKSPFDLLSAIGRDCVGAIQLYHGEKQSVGQIESIVLTEKEIEKILLNYLSFSPDRDLLADFRISLAGAQEKTALLFHQGKWHKPLNSTPTSHIFKLPMGIVGQGQIDLSESCENEWLCLRILQKFGLNVPLAELWQFGQGKALVVERFDRRWSQDNQQLIRLPQEDMCQALNIAPARKYESDGGATMVDIMRLLSGSANPQGDRQAFFKAQILFWLLCAIDGHTKNFSLFLEPNNRYRLTPFYDVISAYPLIKPKGLQKQKIKLAMAWHGETKHYLWAKIQLRHIFATAKAVGLSAQVVEDILDDICACVGLIEEIDYRHLPISIYEPILTGLTHKIHQLNGKFR